MKAIRYDLELRAPVLATDIQGEPNSAVSLPYLPGALLRGAIVGRYLQQQRKSQFDTEDTIARALFLNETTRYLNAYPLNKDGERALPLLKSWRYEKRELPEGDANKRKIYCLEYDPLNDEESDFREEKISEPFGWLEKTPVHRFRPPRQLNVHTRRDARKGRATEDSGDIYRYDALATGLKLQAVIWTADEHAQTLSELLQDATLWIGRARRAGYGEVKVTNVHTQDDWREFDPNGHPGDVTEKLPLQVTLLSPALLRDEYGRATLDPRIAIESALGLPTSTLTIQPEYTFADAMLVGGFNRKWGLPLPQHQALAAGSVFTYQSTAVITSAALAELERQGIGERRNEGYGQVIFNWSASSDGTLSSQTARPPSQEKPVPLVGEELALAMRLAQAFLRKWLEAELQKRINTTHLEAKPGRELPNNHQLGRLRVVIRQLRSNLNKLQQSGLSLQLLENYLKQANDRQAGTALNNAQIREGSTVMPLSEWMLAQLRGAAEYWSSSQFKLGNDEAQCSATVDDVLATGLTLRLIDRVLHRAQKEQTDNG